MCGIGGCYGLNINSQLTPILTAMGEALLHRGPDGVGFWADNDTGVGLVHRRLSIIDLSPEGKQPMVSVSGRYIIVFNGEIYNFEALRQELDEAAAGNFWRGRSDTEVLLACLETWGFEQTLSKLVGMFAMALWDREERLLILVRDRLGEKPLYYGQLDGIGGIFASELKAIRAVSTCALEIDREAVSEFMRFGYIRAPHSIYKGIYKIPPACFVKISLKDGRATSPVSYWNLGRSVQGESRRDISVCSDSELVGVLHDQLKTAVASQLVSDVPLGAFLSGGVDSSVVVALMQAQSSKPVRTFTIGFHHDAFNEAPYAKAVAKHLGTEHTELYVSPDDALAIIPSLHAVYDEPFADSSQIPTILLSRMTRKHVTVALSGDGGDEIFAGYPRYQLTSALWHRIRRYPPPMRKALAAGMAAISPQSWDRLLAFLPGLGHREFNGRRIHRLAQMGVCESLGEMYVRLMTRWQPEDCLVVGTAGPKSPDDMLNFGDDGIKALRRWDVLNYLPDDLLVKVDRAAMSASLETRAPMLDYRVVELAMSLPMRVLVKDGTGKWALRRVLDHYVPSSLIDRPKAGFEVPLADWLRGPLRPWAEALLAPGRLKREGYLDADKVLAVWRQHVSGAADRSLHLWNVLIFESWLEGCCGGIYESRH